MGVDPGLAADPERIPAGPREAENADPQREPDGGDGENACVVTLLFGVGGGGRTDVMTSSDGGRDVSLRTDAVCDL